MSGKLPDKITEITINLHEKFIQRNPFYKGEAILSDVFYGYLRILLACDAAHDFTGTRSTDLVNPGSRSNSPVPKTFSDITNHRSYIARLLPADILRDSVLFEGSGFKVGFLIF